ncbi:MAG: hypothetical protein AAF322_01770 [Pseudomonadota bacterium]
MVRPLRFTITLWTKDPTVAGWADRAGVDRIGVDLEGKSKADRQTGRPTWISTHTTDDLAAVAGVVRAARIFVRCDAFDEDSKAQIDEVIGLGAHVLMLPNFTTLDEVKGFVDAVDGRAEVVPLVERIAAVELLPAFPALGVGEAHVGLNDLSIDLGLSNRLAVLGMPIMDRISELARDNGLRIGFGGLARAGDTSLPVSSDLVYAQQARLGSAGALIARAFFRKDMDEAVFAEEIGLMRAKLTEMFATPPELLEAARLELMDKATGAV